MSGNLVSVCVRFFFLFLECLYKDQTHNTIDDMHEGQSHGKTSYPAGFIFQKPRQFIHAAMEEGVSSYGVSALSWQGMFQDNIVIGTISSAAANLQKQVD